MALGLQILKLSTNRNLLIINWLNIIIIIIIISTWIVACGIKTTANG